MTNANLAALSAAGVSVWLDDLSRQLIASGELASRMSTYSVVGVTTNPAIFQSALSDSSAYETALSEAVAADRDVDAVVRALTTSDVRDACDILADTYRATGGVDGRVSLDNRMCWVDRWLFERLCDRVDNLLKKLPDCESDPALVMDTASRAADLYRGHFLRSDADEVWTTMPRELLRHKYFRLISSMARYSERAGDFEEAARQLLASQETGTELSLVMIDVDRFKRVNDQLGHPQGDKVLRRIGSTLLAHSPWQHLVSRYGGEEFAILMPNTTWEDARVQAERLRIAVHETQYRVGTSVLNMTISAGVATGAVQWVLSRPFRQLYDASFPIDSTPRWESA